SMSMIRDVDETVGRRAAYLRTGAIKSRAVSAVDAVVVALAESRDNAQVLTSDPGDIAALVSQTGRAIRTVAV
ncbi:MAG: hypothetical protein Q4G67_15925, partial [Actinomycetia bacterium]|nr:hypothetical protein [Actinomycetes bacterium]